MLKQTAIAIALVGLSSAAMAGNFQVKVGGSLIAPTQDTTVAGVGVVKAANEYAFTPSVEYFFGNTGLSTEVLLATPVNHDVKIDGANAVKLKHLPPVLTLKYNFNQDGRFNPYVGVGGAAFIPWDVEGVKDVKETFGVAGQVGFTYKPADAQNWGVFFDARYAKLSPEVKVNDTLKFDLDIDPMVYTLGYSYRF